jgi:hypothetical protein
MTKVSQADRGRVELYQLFNQWSFFVRLVRRLRNLEWMEMRTGMALKVKILVAVEGFEPPARGL